MWLTSPATQNTPNLTFIYGSGSVTGPLSQIDVSLGGFTAANQSFLNVQSYKAQPVIDDQLGVGLLGLGFDSLSPANDFVKATYSGATWGRSVMSNIFEANPTTSKHVAFRLDRLFDGNDTDTGSFDIGTFAPGFEAVNNTAPIPIFSPSSARLQYWSVLLDGININGKNQTLNSTVAMGDTKPPAGKLAVLLDTGYSSPQLTSDLFHALYTSMGGVLIQDGTNTTYAVPCMAEASLTFYIG
jgi:saccharopepsin